MGISLKGLVLLLVAVESAFAYQCQQCVYFDVRLVDPPTVPAFENLTAQLSNSLSQSVVNDTSCFHGNSSARMECGDVGCKVQYVSATRAQVIPFGFFNFTIKAASTFVHRSCRDPAANPPPPQSGCVPATLDTPIQVDAYTTSSLRDLVTQDTGMQGGSPPDVDVEGNVCYCYGEDNCNSAPVGTTNAIETSTSTVDGATSTMDSTTNTISTTTGPVSASAAFSSSLLTLLSCIVISR
ncbi:uncharacterized protein LOC106174799 [Lingula anatina]|uniref:Uncharacterized protein LOC106174799 n=1 Tax=Lingula anatina TaxID=7574 RepID=A0A1S3JPP1_LINAN|nr:uncharacterized protein LOC106174799 [Lingula anatina]|eukprot:XP_013411944.1 uncharacterized protein LOC106174799 [Lingula anatina]